MVVADIEFLQPFLQRGDDLRIPVAEAVGSSVQVDVHQFLPVHVVKAAAFAFPDHKIDAQLLPFQSLTGVPPFYGFLKNLFFGDLRIVQQHHAALRCYCRGFR